MSKPIHITSPTHLQTLLQENTYVLLDFTASWCPPCRMIAPIFEQISLANSKSGALAFAKIDVDEQKEIASKYGITAMPTFLLVKNGEVANTVRGANPPAIQGLVKAAVADLETSSSSAAASKKEEKKEDTPAVGGSYTVSSNPDWKTAL